MKIYVISDTHGMCSGIINELKTREKPDLILHLGDYVEDGEKIKEEIGVETLMVKGNGDYFHHNYREDEILKIKDKTIFLTHGHNYNVRYGENNLIYRAMELEADLVLYGHTHIPLFFEESGIKIMNPGSPSFPRGFKRSQTFGIIDIGEEITGEIVEI